MSNQDKKFLEMLREKEEEVARFLFEHFYDYIFRVAFFITKDRQLAEDTVQETFLLALQKFPQLNDEQKLKAWLTKIALNAARTQLRKNRRFPVALDPDLICRWIEKNLPEELVVQKEDLLSIWQSIENLPPEMQQTFILHYHHEMSIKEISTATGVPEGTIKSQLSRGRNFLRRKLQAAGKPDKKPRSAVSVQEVNRT
ncbi:MAG: RNA polymerase sigma factor [Desulfotomaculales bacterium]